MTATQTRRNPRLTDGVDQDLRFLIPEGICRTFRVMPYAAVDGTVLVAAADADDTITAHVVAERIDRPVLLVRHTVNEIVSAIDSVYPPQETEVETPEARRARMQMAQMLTRSGLITDDQLQRAMLEYSRTGDPLGDILVSHEAITEDVLVAALSEMYQMQRVGLADFDARPRGRPPAPRAAGPGLPGGAGRGHRRPGAARRRPPARHRAGRRGRGGARLAVPPAAGQPHRARPADPAGARPALRRGLDPAADGDPPRGLRAHRRLRRPEGRPGDAADRRSSCPA